MNRLWVATAASALLAAVAAVGILVLVVVQDPAELPNHWPEALMLTLPAAAVAAETWAARTARRPTLVAVCVAAGVTATALLVGVSLALDGRGYVRMPRWLRVDVSVWGLMGLPAVAVVVAAVALTRDRLAGRLPAADPDA